MADDNEYSEEQYFAELNARLKDLEEKQRIIKDRLLLIGNNLIETREDFNHTLTEIKKQMEAMKQESERMKSFMETVSDEFSKFAKKDDINILTKQAKMFQPLELVTKSDLEKLKNK
jgi:predicted  nucleic acid-binding Zn-ribbon protein